MYPEHPSWITEAEIVAMILRLIARGVDPHDQAEEKEGAK